MEGGRNRKEGEKHHQTDDDGATKHQSRHHNQPGPKYKSSSRDSPKVSKEGQPRQRQADINLVEASNLDGKTQT